MNDLLFNNLVYNNAYGILGLLSNSTQKEISKRAKDIEKRLKIDDLLEYDYDFHLYNKLRTSSNIKEAQHKLSNPKTQVLQYFFGTSVNSEKEKQFIDKIGKDLSYENIMNYSEAFSKKTFSTNKNIAILLTLLQLTRKTDVALANVLKEKTIELWYEILYNKKSMRDFEKIYRLDDEIGVEDSVFDNLIDNIKHELVTIFSDIAEFQQDNIILANFITTFGIKNSSVNIKQVEECYKNIDKSIEILDSMKISDDGIFDEDEKNTLKINLNNIQTELNNLMDLGLYNDTRTILLRDRIAETIRIQILDLHNNLLEMEAALNLLNIIIKLCGTFSLRTKLEDEKKFIEEVIKKDKSEFLTINLTSQTTIKIFPKKIQINDTEVLYEDVQSTSYLFTTQKHNGVTSSKTFDFQVYTNDSCYNLSTSSAFGINSDTKNENFNKLVWVSQNFIEPLLVNKFYNAILNGKILCFGNIYITKNDYYRRRWRGNTVVNFSSTLTPPTINNGQVVLYNDKNSQLESFTLSKLNAPVFCALIKKCIEENSKIKQFKPSSIHYSFVVNKKFGFSLYEPSQESRFKKNYFIISDFIIEITSCFFGLLFGGFILAIVIGVIVQIASAIFGF